MWYYLAASPGDSPFPRAKALPYLPLTPFVGLLLAIMLRRQGKENNENIKYHIEYM